MAEWKCLTAEEQAMVCGLGHDPGPMVVNRVGEGHWMFLDVQTRTELIVSLDHREKPRGTLYCPEITPPMRPEMAGAARAGAGACGAGSGRGGTSTTDICCI